MNVHDMVVAAIPVLVAIASFFVLRLKLDDKRKETVLHYATLAYGVVEELVRLTDTDLDDKAAAGLKQVLDLLDSNGQKPLSPGETALVKAHFSAMSAEAARQGGAVSPT